jgi:hypothetical protein
LIQGSVTCVKRVKATRHNNNLFHTLYLFLFLAVFKLTSVWF